MIERKFSTFFTENGDEAFKVEFEDKKYDILSTLFFEDGLMIFEGVLRHLEEISRGRLSEWESKGNICYIKITKKNTTVQDISDESNSCTISTKDFETLVREWHFELFKLTLKNGSDEYRALFM